eukprot:GHVN01092879.1.p3 GENE.GHVN01092879.1~~GHVN01092879.1.p3  ORF type:complete len:161 (-),score=4.54 GHVN01092879.1:246-728(-)
MVGPLVVVLSGVNAGQHRFADPVEQDSQQHDSEAGDQSDAQFKVADTAQDQYAKTGCRDQRGDDHHGQGHHDGLVNTGHNIGQGQGHFDPGESLAPAHAEGIRCFDHILVDHPDTQIGQADHRYDGVEDNGDAIELRFGDTEQEDQWYQVDEGWQCLQHI